MLGTVISTDRRLLASSHVNEKSPLLILTGPVLGDCTLDGGMRVIRQLDLARQLPGSRIRSKPELVLSGGDCLRMVS